MVRRRVEWDPQLRHRRARRLECITRNTLNTLRAREDDRGFVALPVVEREVDVTQPQAALADQIVGRPAILVPHLFVR